MITVMIVILIIIIKAQVVMIYTVPWVNYTRSPGMPLWPEHIQDLAILGDV